MNTYYYCSDCKRIFSTEDKCTYCGGENVYDLNLNAPVNVLGSKLKGKVLSTKGDKIRVLIKGDGKDKMIRDYTAAELKKVL